jgi:excisionase family DNA binding protein
MKEDIMNNNVLEKEVLTVSQVAEYLQLSEMTTYKMVQEGKIPAFKIGRSWRVKKSDLEALIERLKKGERL